MRIFALADGDENSSKKKGLVVQLVRIHACHAWGRGFESRPDRPEKASALAEAFLLSTTFIFSFPFLPRPHLYLTNHKKYIKYEKNYKIRSNVSKFDA